MNRTLKAMALCAALAMGAASAAGEMRPCGDENGMHGMRERVRTMHEQMDRIERTAERAEQARLLDLHAKQMREGVREMRSRDLGPECRAEMMSSLMEELVRHQLAMSEREAR